VQASAKLDVILGHSEVCKLNKLSTILALGCLLSFGSSSAADATDADDSLSAVESWYPRVVTSDKGTAVIYAPQVETWIDFDVVTAWVAFQIIRSGSEDTYYGSLHFDAATETDVQSREVLLHDIKIRELTIEGLTAESEEYRLIHEAFSTISRTVPLDLVLEYLPRDMPITSATGLNTNPPRIFASTEPALLLSTEAEPMFVPVGVDDLQFVINTNWDVLRVGDEGALFFCYDNSWLTASQFDGSWVWAESLPESFQNIPDDPNWSNVKHCLPDNLRVLSEPQTAAPMVYYSSEPAELIMLAGPADWESIGTGGLNFAVNTRQELFRVGDTVFLLVSGRWFEATQLAGPWVLATTLPDVFQEIPPENGELTHAKSYVRKSVPGTRESWEAALVASIPRQAVIARGTESELELDLSYAGEPSFTAIENTDIEMAINTSYQVFRYEDNYYLCHNAVWLSASSATGPWQFADMMPSEFATIPASSPAYNTTFVTVDDSDAETIDYEYTTGYEGAYVSDTTVVYGTGYPSPAVTLTIAYGIHDGWWGYPYYPWPPTYGYGSWYDPGTGRYGETVVAYGPYGAAGSSAVYNPQTGAYARGQAVWDSDEFAGRGFAYNPNTATSIARNRYIDFDDNEGWSQSVAQRGDEWRYTQSQWEDGRMVTDFESSRGTEGQVVREREGDTIVSEGSIQGENRSATFDSVIDDGAATTNIQGSEGGSGEMTRQLEDGELSGSGSFTKDGNTINSETTRNAEGVSREFETSGGAQGKTVRSGDESAFVVQSGSGDVYAGKDGKVYQKSDDGWSPVENPGSRQSTDRSAPESRAATSQWGGSTSLDRDFQSRQNGFDRYSQHQSIAGQGSRSRNNRRRRR